MSSNHANGEGMATGAPQANGTAALVPGRAARDLASANPSAT
jgi:hypothetical protein